jgi:50S ribosomal subunit-associated GTPase HflX
VQEADILIHVVDVADPNLMLKVEAVERVLAIWRPPTSPP